MDEKQVFRLWNYYPNGTLRDMYESDDLNDVYDKWLDETIEHPDSHHKVLAGDSEVQPLWENDIEQAASIQNGGEPTKIWAAKPEDWETKEMRQVPWYVFGYTDFWE
jgi:hypothetical protein